MQKVVYILDLGKQVQKYQNTGITGSMDHFAFIKSLTVYSFPRIQGKYCFALVSSLLSPYLKCIVE